MTSAAQPITDTCQPPKRAIRRRFWLQWAETYGALQTAPWRECWAHSKVEARQELEEKCKANGCNYGRVKGGEEKATKPGRKTGK